MGKWAAGDIVFKSSHDEPLKPPPSKIKQTDKRPEELRQKKASTGLRLKHQTRPGSLATNIKVNHRSVVDRALPIAHRTMNK